MIGPKKKTIGQSIRSVNKSGKKGTIQTLGGKFESLQNTALGNLKIQSGLPRGAMALNILYMISILVLLVYVIFWLIPDRKGKSKDDSKFVTPRVIAGALLLLSLYNFIYMFMLRPCFKGKCELTTMGYGSYMVFLLFGVCLCAATLGILNDDKYEPPEALSSTAVLGILFGVTFLLLVAAVYKVVTMKRV